MTTRLLIIVALLFCLAGCSDEDSPTAPEPTFPITFRADIQPIFSNRCAISGCHAPPTPKADCDLRAGQSYANIVNVPATVFGPGMRVLPNDAEASILYQLVSSGTMPQTGGKLTSKQIEAIRAWIDSGAQND
jgi:hypothetical protein